MLTARYGLELLRDRGGVDAIAALFDLDPFTRRYLAGYPRSSIAGPALLCRQLHDIGHADRRSGSLDRVRAGLVGGLVIVLTDVVDGQLDRPLWAPVERDRYLTEGVELLINGTRPRRDPENEHQWVSFALAGALHRHVVSRDDGLVLGPLVATLATHVRAQLTSHDIADHLGLAIQVAGACVHLAVAASSQLIGRAVDPATAAAATGIGGYAGCLDHAYELDVDRRAGVATYATLYLCRYGDTRTTRRQARRDLLAAAARAYHKGGAVLDARQLTIYRSARRMISLRYRAFHRVQTWNPF